MIKLVTYDRDVRLLDRAAKYGYRDTHAALVVAVDSTVVEYGLSYSGVYAAPPKEGYSTSLDLNPKLWKTSDVLTMVERSVDYSTMRFSDWRALANGVSPKISCATYISDVLRLPPIGTPDTLADLLFSTGAMVLRLPGVKVDKFVHANRLDDSEYTTADEVLVLCRHYVRPPSKTSQQVRVCFSGYIYGDGRVSSIFTPLSGMHHTWTNHDHVVVCPTLAAGLMWSKGHLLEYDVLGTQKEWVPQSKRVVLDGSVEWLPYVVH